MTFTIAPARHDQLPAINQVIEQAVMQWDLPERVKRLSLPTYQYNELDYDHLEMVVALLGDRVVGVAGWEPADPRDTPGQSPGLLLHGLYVTPEYQHRGIGSALLNTALQAAAEQNLAGLLVKAQKEAVGFFASHGMTALPVEDEIRHYATRFWRTTANL